MVFNRFLNAISCLGPDLDKLIVTLRWSDKQTAIELSLDLEDALVRIRDDPVPLPWNRDVVNADSQPADRCVSEPDVLDTVGNFRSRFRAIRMVEIL